MTIRDQSIPGNVIKIGDFPFRIKSRRFGDAGNTMELTIEGYIDEPVSSGGGFIPAEVMDETACAWCGQWHPDDAKTASSALCDLSLAATRLVVIIRRPVQRLLKRHGNSVRAQRSLEAQLSTAKADLAEWEALGRAWDEESSAHIPAAIVQQPVAQTNTVSLRQFHGDNVWRDDAGNIWEKR